MKTCGECEFIGAKRVGLILCSGGGFPGAWVSDFDRWCSWRLLIDACHRQRDRARMAEKKLNAPYQRCSNCYYDDYKTFNKDVCGRCEEFVTFSEWKPKD